MRITLPSLNPGSLQWNYFYVFKLVGVSCKPSPWNYFCWGFYVDLVMLVDYSPRPFSVETVFSSIIVRGYPWFLKITHRFWLIGDDYINTTYIINIFLIKLNFPIILYNIHYKYFLNKIEFSDNFDSQCSKYTLNVTHSLIMHEHTYGTMW